MTRGKESTLRRPSLRYAVAPLLLAAMACTHARSVGRTTEEAGQEEQRGAAAPKTATVRPHPGHPAVSATPEGLMAPGSVRRIQQALRDQGLLEQVTGALDPPTSAALRRFQRQQDLPETGAPDRETLRKLGLSPEDVYRNVPQGHEQAPPAGS